MSTALHRPPMTANRGSNPIPMPGNIPGGGSRRFVQSEVLIMNASAGVYTDVDARFVINNPSVRMRLKVALGYKPDGAEVTFPQSGTGAWYLRLDARDRTKEGLILLTNNIVTNLPLPTSYEASTMNDQWLGTVTVPSLPGTGIASGLLYVIAAWEPDAGWAGTDQELQRIFAACTMQVVQSTAASTTGGVVP